MPTLKYLDPITGTYKAIASLTPGVPANVPPPSGVWGAGELGKYSTMADTNGREIYVDSTGKLRAKPDVINYGGGVRPPTDPVSDYPVGTSVMTISSGGGSAWPAGASCIVVTHRRVDTDTAAQWCYLNSGTVSKSWYRNGTTAGWAPWVGVAEYSALTANATPTIVTPNATNFTMTNSSANIKNGICFLYIAGTMKVVSSSPGTSGDITNIALGTLNAAYLPAVGPFQYAMGAVGSGRPLAGYVLDGGTIGISGIGGSTALAVGEVVSLSGSYPV